MKLLSNDMSPFGRKVRIVIAELGIGERIDIVDARPRDRPEDVTFANPVGKIPVLIDDEGRPIFDSAVICDYLDSEFGGGRLIPPARRWQVLSTTALADGIIDAAILVRNERLRPAALQSADWADWQLAKVRRGLDALETRAGEIAAVFDLGQIAVGCAIDYVPRRLDEFAGLAAWPRLAALAATLAERPSFAVTKPL